MSSIFPVMLNLKLNNIQTSGQTGPKVSVTKLHNLNCDFMQHVAETEATYTFLCEGTSDYTLIIHSIVQWHFSNMNNALEISEYVS